MNTPNTTKQTQTDKAKHTPGPWELMPHMTSGWQDLNEIQSETGEYIVRVRNEANARLIASAPELLEALKEAKEALLNLSPEARERGHYGDFKNDDCPCTICKIDKAIGDA